MDRWVSCEFNMDTACAELKDADGSMIAIDTIAVENEASYKNGICRRKTNVTTKRSSM